jgi:hypothetical protein
MRNVTLPEDLRIYAPNEFEARTLYQEIFAEKVYSSYGIRVADGDCVFDVGANIGLYSIFLARAHRDLTIFAFEPIPQTFAILEKNIESLTKGSRIKLFNIGLSKEPGSARFELDRFLSFTATMRAEEVDSCVRKDAGMRAWAEAGVYDFRKLGFLSPGFARRLQSVLRRPLVGRLVAAVMFSLLCLAALRKKLFLQKIDCPLKTVSEVIREHRLGAIDLIKIDVEGSEWDVIEGIAEEDWPKIKQFVVEAHDVDGRVEKMRSAFEARGYLTAVSQEDWGIHKLINAFTIYAARG